MNYGAGTIAVTFYCGDPLVDTRDGQSYNTVQIGSQCWMAENLNIGTMVNGSDDQINNGIIEKYCNNDSISNCDTYGGLYQWNEAMQYVAIAGTQGICPDNWHFPSDTEYKTMEIQLGMSSSDANNTGYRGTDEGSKLAANEPLWTDGNLDQNANFGVSGFGGLPGGSRFSPNGSFSISAYTAYFWSSSAGNYQAISRLLYYSDPRVFRSFNGKNYGFRVRCVQD